MVGATAPCFSFQQPISYYLYSQTEIADHIGRHFFPQAIFTIECAADFVMCSGRVVNPRTPEHSGVNYSTPELFWGWVEEIPTQNINSDYSAVFLVLKAWTNNRLIMNLTNLVMGTFTPEHFSNHRTEIGVCSAVVKKLWQAPACVVLCSPIYSSLSLKYV